jgi:hypothetical protein
MGVLAWTMMGLALWHFTVFVPDRFWGGIVGAFIGAIAGAILFGLAIHGFSVPGQDATDIGTVMEAVPGTIIGVAIVYAIGARAEREDRDPSGLPAA